MFLGGLGSSAKKNSLTQTPNIKSVWPNSNFCTFSSALESDVASTLRAAPTTDSTRGHTQVRIDHRSSTLHFEGAQLRNDRMASHLATIAGRLSGAAALIAPDARAKAQAARRAATAARVHATADSLHDELLARKVLIERRKEKHEQEREAAEREEEEKRRAEQVRALSVSGLLHYCSWAGGHGRLWRLPGGCSAWRTSKHAQM
jgi:hypothetical protein